MKTKQSVILIAIIAMLSACGGPKKSQPPQITQENFLTLADVTGRTSFKEDSPDIRVINVKAKAFIKRNDIRSAKQKAIANASEMAVDAMVRELLSAEIYNRRYEEIDRYFSTNIDKYIVDRNVNGERPIYLGKFYGISASFKISRQRVLVALQKDLKVIDTSHSTLITVVTSKKDVDLSAIGFRFSDIEDALMNQIQTDLNQRGLVAMDFRNAVASLQVDEKKRAAFAKISKAQFMAAIAGSKPGDAALNDQMESIQQFYSTGLPLLKQLAKVVIEVNILSVSQTGNTTVLNLSVTAKNISVGTGGAFANTIVQAGRRGGSSADTSAMLTGLIKDAYDEMRQEFIPQVIKEMSTIDARGNKLVRYELVMKGFTGKEPRKVRRAVENAQNETLRYIDFDNTLQKAQPSLVRVFIRFAGKASKLGDRILDILESAGISVEEPIVAPGLTDLVFEKSPVVED